MVGLGGLEPPTSRLSSARSNQLSYKPELSALTLQPEPCGPSSSLELRSLRTESPLSGRPGALNSAKPKARPSLRMEERETKTAASRQCASD
jgi:hypothetical protein